MITLSLSCTISISELISGQNDEEQPQMCEGLCKVPETSAQNHVRHTSCRNEEGGHCEMYDSRREEGIRETSPHFRANKSNVRCNLLQTRQFLRLHNTQQVGRVATALHMLWIPIHPERDV